MALELISEKQLKTATNTIDGFDVQYSYEHVPGEKPEVVKARATKEGSDTVLDAMYHLRTSNFNTTFHYLNDEADLNISVAVLKDMKELAK